MCSFGSCQTRFEFLSQFRKVRNAFWVFRNTGANAFANNQTRLAYEDKRDLYCNYKLCFQKLNPTTTIQKYHLFNHLSHCSPYPNLMFQICPWPLSKHHVSAIHTRAHNTVVNKFRHGSNAEMRGLLYQLF